MSILSYPFFHNEIHECTLSPLLPTTSVDYHHRSNNNGDSYNSEHTSNNGSNRRLYSCAKQNNSLTLIDNSLTTMKNGFTVINTSATMVDKDFTRHQWTSVPQ